jgi:hypothetical protein
MRVGRELSGADAAAPRRGGVKALANRVEVLLELTDQPF